MAKSTLSISRWLREATKQLKDIGIGSSRLDAELILAETIRQNRTYLHAHLDDELDPRRVDIANARLELRKDRVPLAYILGHKEFYGRSFAVAPSVLVPRPESEDMITLLLEITADDISPSAKTLIDIGTGSGCLGITAKLERPELSVTLADVDSKALQVAEKNAKSLGASVQARVQNLLIGQVEPLNYILANLPYVSSDWEVSPETYHEPRHALYAKNNGLALIVKLIDQSASKLVPNGWMLLEADPEQHPSIVDHATKLGFVHHKTLGYCLALRLIRA